jgi:hypothetical protein
MAGPGELCPAWSGQTGALAYPRNEVVSGLAYMDAIMMAVFLAGLVFLRLGVFLSLREV